MCFLSEKESRIFINVILDEEKDLVNEYDPDTRRIPGRTRMNALPDIRNIIQKWNATQTPIGVVHMTHNIYNTGAPAPCAIELNKTERSVALRLLGK